MSNLSPEQRYQEIRVRLAKLGDVSAWHGESVGQLTLHPAEDKVIHVANVPESDLYDWDLLVFLADAPFAIQFLLTVVADQ